MSRRDAAQEHLTCSFCGKNQDDVKKLIAGPAVFICDECIEPVSYTHLTLPTNREV